MGGLREGFSLLFGPRGPLMEPLMSVPCRPPVSVSQQLSFSSDQIFLFFKYFCPCFLLHWPNIYVKIFFPSATPLRTKNFPSPIISLRFFLLKRVFLLQIFFSLFPIHFSSPPRKIFSFYKYFPLFSDRIKDQLADVSRPFGLVKPFPFQDLVLSIFR